MKALQISCQVLDKSQRLAHNLQAILGINWNDYSITIIVHLCFLIFVVTFKLLPVTKYCLSPGCECFCTLLPLSKLKLLVYHIIL